MVYRFVLWLIFPIILTGCSLSTAPKILILDPTVREARVSSPTAEDLYFRCICDTETGETTSQVYMTIRNLGVTADRLIKVETQAAVKVELRRPGVLADNESLSMLMESVEIPVMSSVVFKPGQYQMTFAGLKEDLITGEKVIIRLFFEHSGDVEVEALITSREWSLQKQGSTSYYVSDCVTYFKDNGVHPLLIVDKIYPFKSKNGETMSVWSKNGSGS